MNQTLALLVDAYRELNAKKLFWLTMILSGCVIGIFALFGVDDKGYSFLWWHFSGPMDVPAAIMYRVLFSYLGIGLWLTFCAAILALISTAFIFPDFLTGGTIDLYLSKPISRVRLFLTKYIAGLMFVTLQVLAFSAASFLVLGLRGGIWLPSIFWAVPIVVCFFSYLFSVSVLFGVMTRSTIAALLLTCLFWGLIAITDRLEPWLLLHKTEQEQSLSLMDGQAKNLDAKIATAQKAPPTTDPADAAVMADLQSRRTILAEHQAMTESLLDKLRMFHNIVYGIKTVAPKTTDTVDLLDRWVDPTDPLATARRRNRRSSSADDPLGMQTEQTSRTEVHDELLNRPLWWVVGTSLIFEAMVLLLAGWIFCRRDY